VSNVTKEGITVRAGQVWRDLDKRSDRTVTVIEVQPDALPHPYAYVRTSAGRYTRVRISRMHWHAQGYALVSEPQA
jgi:hypothetical protein